MMYLIIEDVNRDSETKVKAKNIKNYIRYNSFFISKKFSLEVITIYNHKLDKMCKNV